MTVVKSKFGNTSLKWLCFLSITTLCVLSPLTMCLCKDKLHICSGCSHVICHYRRGFCEFWIIQMHIDPRRILVIYGIITLPFIASRILRLRCESDSARSKKFSAVITLTGSSLLPSLSLLGYAIAPFSFPIAFAIGNSLNISLILCFVNPSWSLGLIQASTWISKLLISPSALCAHSLAVHKE